MKPRVLVKYYLSYLVGKGLPVTVWLCRGSASELCNSLAIPAHVLYFMSLPVRVFYFIPLLFNINLRGVFLPSAVAFWVGLYIKTRFDKKKLYPPLLDAAVRAEMLSDKPPPPASARRRRAATLAAALVRRVVKGMVSHRGIVAP